MISSGALGGVPSENVQFLTTSGSIYVPNEPSTLAVKKLWYSEDGAETTPGAEEVKIDLIQQAVKSNAIAVTIISKSTSEWGENQITTVTNVAPGSDLTITVNAWKSKPLLIQIGDNPEDEMAYNSSTGDHTYTVEDITSPLTIYVLNDEDTNVYQHAVSGFTVPYFEAVGKPVVYGTATLSEENSWSYLSREGITFVITNTLKPSEEPAPTPQPSSPPTPGEPTLPQTGVLWWPVPLLAILGALLLLLGWGLRRRDER